METRRPQPGENEKLPQIRIFGGFAGCVIYKKDGKELVECPFNKAHILRLTRLQYHLAKCIKHYKGDKLRCLYNATEYVDPSNYLSHLQDCPSRISELAHSHRSSENEEKLPHIVKGNYVPIQQTVPYEEGDELDWC